jgi:hypothetical protein
MLQDLDPKQIETFLQRWHDLAYADEYDRSRKLERLRGSIRRSTAIRELAQNPLLLTLMALLNRHQELPRDRTELYTQASRLLLQQWDASRALPEDAQLAGKGLDSKDKQAKLRAVAREMQSGEAGLARNAIAADKLEDVMACGVVYTGWNTAGAQAGWPSQRAGAEAWGCASVRGGDRHGPGESGLLMTQRLSRRCGGLKLNRRVRDGCRDPSLRSG